MSFTKKNIPAKTYCIIDIGSYKIRACAAAFKNRKISLLGYHEKRQDISYFSNNECLNIPGLCTNIADIIEWLEKKIWFSLPEIILSYPFGEIFLQSRQIHYKRKDENVILEKKELEEIFESLEKMYLKKQIHEIEKNYGYKKQELQVILSRIHDLRIDGKKEKKLLWKKGEKIHISLINWIIPRNKQTLMMQIGNVIGKKIIKILPSEYSISEMFDLDEVLIINIGATQTSLTLKNNGYVSWVTKVPVGIHHLIEKIARNHKISRAETLSLLWNPWFEKEKTFFLEVWGESFGISLHELLWNNICPKRIYIWWGGAHNNFMKEYITQFTFSHYNISAPGKIEFVSEDLAPILKIMENIQIENISRISLEMYGLLLETHYLIKREHDSVSNTLKSVIKKLWYIWNE